jgi:hypothetical protein
MAEPLTQVCCSYMNTLEQSRSISIISTKPVKQPTDLTNKLEASIIKHNAVEKTNEIKNSIFYSDPKFRAAPPISIGLVPIGKTCENQMRFDNKTPEVEGGRKDGIPKQQNVVSREKEGELFKKRVTELKLKLSKTEKLKTEVESENTLLGSKIDEVKRVLSWRNKENIEEVFSQLALILN